MDLSAESAASGLPSFCSSDLQARCPILSQHRGRVTLAAQTFVREDAQLFGEQGS